MNEVLQQAAQRATAASHDTKATQQQVIDQMRQDIGTQRYEECKRQLPEIERVINTIFLPFAAQVVAIADKSQCPFPTPLRGWVVAIQDMCVQGPQQLRQAIAAYEQLSFSQVRYRDGRSVDVNMRAEVVGSIRQLLGSYDGMVSFLENQKAQAERFITESGWPKAQAVGSGTIVPAREESREIVVETR
jgi:hypothetical protein